MKKGIDDWFKREWKDAERILELDREGLLWQIWQERSNKLLWGMLGGMLGIIFGLCLEDITLFFRGLS